MTTENCFNTNGSLKIDKAGDAPLEGGAIGGAHSMIDAPQGGISSYHIEFMLAGGGWSKKN